MNEFYIFRIAEQSRLQKSCNVFSDNSNHQSQWILSCLYLCFLLGSAEIKDWCYHTEVQTCRNLSIVSCSSQKTMRTLKQSHTSIMSEWKMLIKRDWFLHLFLNFSRLITRFVLIFIWMTEAETSFVTIVTCSEEEKLTCSIHALLMSMSYLSVLFWEQNIVQSTWEVCLFFSFTIKLDLVNWMIMTHLSCSSLFRINFS